MVGIVGLGLIQNEHGVWCVRRKVPKRLEEAVARAMGAPKARVSWLKESLRTKDEGQAKILSKPVMMKFDRILAEAEALLVEQPVRTSLTDAEMHKVEESASVVLPALKGALARGNVEFIRYELNELLQVFRINLDPNCSDYGKLALAVMRAEVRALEAIQARHRGEPIESPKLIEPAGGTSALIGLRVARGL